MDTYADDLAELMATLDLKDAMLVGHSTGREEVVRYIDKTCGQVVLIGAVPPLMLKTPENPNGLPIEVFDGYRGHCQPFLILQRRGDSLFRGQSSWSINLGRPTQFDLAPNNALRFHRHVFLHQGLFRD